jgi:hypothetical protein
MHGVFNGNSALSNTGPIAVYCPSTLKPSASHSTNLINFNVILHNRILYSDKNKFVPVHAMKVCRGVNLQPHSFIAWLTNTDNIFSE